MTRNFIPDVVHIIDNAETDWLQFPYWERAIACDTFTFFHWLTQKDLITATFLLRNFKEYATILNHLRKDVGEHLLESSCQDPRECEINPSNAWVHLRSPATKSTHMSVICDEFWYNLETGQSTFTPPEGFAPPEFQRKCDLSRAILAPSLSSPDDSKVRLANNITVRRNNRRLKDRGTSQKPSRRQYSESRRTSLSEGPAYCSTRKQRYPRKRSSTVPPQLNRQCEDPLVQRRAWR